MQHRMSITICMSLRSMVDGAWIPSLFSAKLGSLSDFSARPLRLAATHLRLQLGNVKAKIKYIVAALICIIIFLGAPRRTSPPDSS